MKRLRTLPRRRVYAIVAAVALLAATGGIAQAALNGSDPKPAPKPLAAAVLDSLRAPKLQGVSARVHFTNNLFPSGTLPAGTSSPLTTGADGQLWLSSDGRFRIDLRSQAGGEAQIVSDGTRLTVYDGASNTLYALPTPQSVGGGDHGAAQFPLQGIQNGLGNLLRSFTISGAKPSSTAGRPTYTVRIAPRDDGGLLGAAEVAWDAERGVPLRLAVYAQGNSDPTLELKATEVSYGRVPDAQLAATPHPGAHTVSIDAADLRAAGRPTNVTGVGAVQKRLDFPLAAPDAIAGLNRGEVRLFKSDGGNGAMTVYGKGLGSIFVLQGKQSGNPFLDHTSLRLPEVNINGHTGTELATPLGTLVTFERGGVSYLVGGLVPPVAAENAARDLR